MRHSFRSDPIRSNLHTLFGLRAARRCIQIESNPRLCRVHILPLNTSDNRHKSSRHLFASIRLRVSSSLLFSSLRNSNGRFASSVSNSESSLGVNVRRYLSAGQEPQDTEAEGHVDRTPHRNAVQQVALVFAPVPRPPPHPVRSAGRGRSPCGRPAVGLRFTRAPDTTRGGGSGHSSGPAARHAALRERRRGRDRWRTRVSGRQSPRLLLLE